MIHWIEPVFTRVAPFVWAINEFNFGTQSNALREKRLAEEKIFDPVSFMIFGDSQVAYWNMQRFFGDFPVKNRGVSGDCSFFAMPRFDREITSKSPPAAVAILIGTNDIARGRTEVQIVEDVMTLARKAMGRGVFAYVCSLLPVRGTYVRSRSPRVIETINELLKQQTVREGMAYLDFWGTLVDPQGNLKKEFTYDGLHPSRAAYKLMSGIMINAFQEFIGRQQ